jgi:hypothetical protein
MRADKQEAMETMNRAVDTRHPATADELPVGAHLMTRRTGYIHHGIYAGNGQVVHYAGWSRALRRGPVQQVSLVEFARGREFWIARRCDILYTGDDVVLRARSRLGEDRYRLTTNNCEHFCAWCITGESRSDQVDRWLGWNRRLLGAVLGVACQILGTVPAGRTVQLLLQQP